MVVMSPNSSAVAVNFIRVTNLFLVLIEDRQYTSGNHLIPAVILRGHASHIHTGKKFWEGDTITIDRRYFLIIPAVNITNYIIYRIWW